MAIFGRNRTNPTTRYQKGRRWATATLAFCSLFSMYANVRSGQISVESVLWSAAPPTVLFLTVHVISYLTPKSRIRKALVWFGLGFVTIVAFGASGYHIVTQAMENGQPWYTALCYPFLLDIPSLMCAAVLVTKDKVTQAAQIVQAVAIPATVPTPPKATPARANAAKRATPAKTTKPAVKASPAKTTKPSQKTPTPTFSAKVEDPTEIEMINAGNGR